MAILTRRALLGGATGLILAGTSTAAYATVVEPGLRLTVAEYRPTLPRWPASHPLNIAVLSDLHAGEPWMTLARVERIVETANALRPDLIVILGDYAANHRFMTRALAHRDVARTLARLNAPLGVHAILGNHDWWDDPEAVKSRGAKRPAWDRALQDAGIPVMENSATRIQHRGQPFWLLGLGDHWAFRGGPDGRYHGVGDLDATLALVQDETPAILLTHEPDIFTRVPDRVALTLAGHTHGGQVRIFGYSPSIPSEYGDRFAYGHIVEDGRHMIVSGGLGMSVYPIRFGVPPEITMVRLGGASALSRSPGIV